MVHVILLCCVMIGDDGKPGPATTADRAAYGSAHKKAGKDATAQIRLALWCEEHGLTAERVKHLALAIAYDPKNALARASPGWLPITGNGRALRTSARTSRMTLTITS